jgi:hypothetical protein
MKKISTLLFLISLTISSFSQISLFGDASGGFSKYYSIPQSRTYKPYLSYSAGLSGEYQTRFGFGINCGLRYDVKQSKYSNLDYRLKTTSIAMPLSLLIYTGSPSNGLIIGTSIHRNLNSYKMGATEAMKSWHSYHIGYYYNIKDRFRIALIAENDWTPIAVNTYGSRVEDFFANINLSVSYKLFTF